MPIRSISVFGQLRYKIVPCLELSGGVRFTNEKRRDRAATVDLFGSFGTPGAPVVPDLPRRNVSNWSPEATINWTPTDDLTIFGSLRQGYKSGSYNLIIPVNPGQNNSFGDEKVQGGEVGLKARSFDRQLFTNLAFYYYKYDGLQVGLNEPAAGGVPIIRTLNGGKAKSYGVDFDATFRPRAIEGLSANAAASFDIPKFTRFTGAPCTGGQTIADGCNSDPAPVTDPADIAAGYFAVDPATGAPLRFQGQDLSGARLPRAPRWQVTFGLEYERPAGAGLVFGGGLNMNYSSRYLAVLGRRDDFFQGAYAKLNANARVRAASGVRELAFVANNLTDKYVTANCTITNYPGGQAFPGTVTGAPIRGPAGVDEVVCAYDRGRELWLRLTLRPRR